EGPAARLPAALRHHRAGAVVPLGLPLAGADLLAPLRPDRLAGVGLVAAGARLGHRLVAGHRHVLDVLLVDRLAGVVADRHLVLLPHRLADGVAVLADVLLVDGVVGGPAEVHLVLLADRP